MKILFVTPNFPSDTNIIGGLYIYELAQALRSLRADVRVIHLDASILWPFCLLARYQRKHSISPTNGSPWLIRYHFFNLPRSFGLMQRATWWHMALVKLILKTWPGFQPDIVHAHTIIPGAVAAKGLAKHFGCPLVISTHGADTRVWFHRQTAHNTIRRFYRQSVPIICVSESIQNQLMQDGADPSNLYLIYNGMDIRKVHQGENPVLKKYHGKILVVGVGNLKVSKGFDLFLKAIAHLKPFYPNLHGVVVGGGQEQQTLQRLILHLGLTDTVLLVGTKPPNETMAYISASDIFCLPSWSEGFGIAYLEAMAHGKPVIAVEGQGISRIVFNNQTGILVSPKDEWAVAAAIQSLIKQPNLRMEMGLRGKFLIQSEFTWKHCAMHHIKLYENILAKTKK